MTFSAYPGMAAIVDAKPSGAQGPKEGQSQVSANTHEKGPTPLA